MPDKEQTGKQANIFGHIARKIQVRDQRHQKAAEATASLIQANNPFAGAAAMIGNSQRNMTF